MFHAEYYRQKEKQEALIARKNVPSDFYNGIYTRWTDPVLTRDHAPLHWRYDLNPETNPHFMERLGVNAVFNAGAIEMDGRFCLVARVEGMDRKSFFAVAESKSGVDGFRFWDYPVVLPDTCPEETNVYDMRLTRHEDGWIYGVFCHIAHGVRNTAAGLRYVIYAYATDLKEPWKVIAEPGGFLIAPLGAERVGDVSNVVFTNGAIVRDNGDVYIYYASDDTRLHVATTTVERLVDYVFNTPADALRSADCVKQRCQLIRRNLEYLRNHPEN